jgi:hypothetical protein
MTRDRLTPVSQEMGPPVNPARFIIWRSQRLDAWRRLGFITLRHRTRGQAPLIGRRAFMNALTAHGYPFPCLKIMNVPMA